MNAPLLNVLPLRAYACSLLIVAASHAAWAEVRPDGAPPGSAGSVSDETALLVVPEQGAPPPPEGEQAGEPEKGLYSGHVSWQDSGAPVEGALVIFKVEGKEGDFRTTTDKNGAYRIWLPKDKYDIKILVKSREFKSLGDAKAEVPGKKWAVTFVPWDKRTDSDIILETGVLETSLVPTYDPAEIEGDVRLPVDPVHKRRKRWEFFSFLGGLIAVGALSE